MIPELLQDPSEVIVRASALSLSPGNTIGGFDVSEGNESALGLEKQHFGHEIVRPKVLGAVPECRTYSSAPEPKMGSDRVQPDIPELVQESSEVVFQASLCPPEMLTIGSFKLQCFGEQGIGFNRL
jgi:hypothetical protein